MVKTRDINKETLTTIKAHIITERGSGKALQLHPPHAGAARIKVAPLQGKGRWLLLKRTTSMRGQGTRGRGSGKAVRLEAPAAAAATTPPKLSTFDLMGEAALLSTTTTVHILLAAPGLRAWLGQVWKERQLLVTMCATAKEPVCLEDRRSRGEQTCTTARWNEHTIFLCCPLETWVCLKCDCWLPEPHIDERRAQQHHYQGSRDRSHNCSLTAAWSRF